VRRAVDEQSGAQMRRPPLIEREDVDAILGVLFDLHRELVRIRQALEEDDGREAEED
jgi:hypothetical protein